MDKNLAGTIDRFRNALEESGIHVKAMVLFGSHAKGHPTEQSDIDVVVISDDFEGMSLLERLETIGTAMARKRMMEPIEALAYTENEYIQNGRGTLIGDEVKAHGTVLQ